MSVAAIMLSRKSDGILADVCNAQQITRQLVLCCMSSETMARRLRASFGRGGASCSFCSQDLAILATTHAPGNSHYTVFERERDFDIGWL